MARKIDKRTEENIKKIKLFLKKNANTIKRSNNEHHINDKKC